MWRAFRRLLALLLLGALAIIGVRALYRALASAETKIRWRIEAMVEGFNDARVRPVLAGVAQGFVDRVEGVTRDDLRTNLAWTFHEERDGEGGFLWRAELDPEELSIELAEGERSAAVACRVRFFRRRGEATELRWDARIEGTLALLDDGWQWSEVRSANYRELRR